MNDRLVLPLPDNNSLEFIRCRAGSFLMGSPPTEMARFQRETSHKVTLTSGFWIGKYPLTQLQFYAIMGYNPAEFLDKSRPVESISWREACHLCRCATECLKPFLPPKAYVTLPTEAQWEYACRAGTDSALYNGQELTCLRGTCESLSEIAWYRSGQEFGTKPVGLLLPNAWGIYDMLGNVFEWCLDYYSAGYYEQSPRLNPRGPEYSDKRVLRGGCWNDEAQCCRSAFRGFCPEEYQDSDTGVRLAIVKEKL